MKTCSCKNLYMYLYSSIIQKFQKQPKYLSFNGWIYKQTVVNSFNTILLRNKKEWTVDIRNLCMNLKYIMLNEKSHAVVLHLYEFFVVKAKL